MKNFKNLILIALVAILPLSFASCLNGDDDSLTWDSVGTGTAVQNVMGGVTVYMDNGLTFTLTNPSVLTSMSPFPKRVFAYYKLADGEKFSETVTKYNVTLLNGSILLVGTIEPEGTTVTNDYGITKFDEGTIDRPSSIVSINGYLNVRFYCTGASTGLKETDFPLVAEGVEVDGTLVLRLYNTSSGDKDYTYSLQYPLYEIVEEYTDGSYTGTPLAFYGDKNDQIKVKIVSTLAGKTEDTSYTLQCAYKENH